MSENYPYYADWAREDGEFVGTCPVYPSLSYLASKPTDALDGIKALVREVELDFKVEEWHLGYGGDVDLHEYLGMTIEEYYGWVRDPLELLKDTKK